MSSVLLCARAISAADATGRAVVASVVGAAANVVVVRVLRDTVTVVGTTVVGTTVVGTTVDGAMVVEASVVGGTAAV